jgi:hypothetical protein
VIVRRVHRLLGLVLLLPLLGWSATGLVFFLKPGYAAAYGTVRVFEYPLDGTLDPRAAVPAGALEARWLRSVLGDHLLVRLPSGPHHFDARGERFPLPGEASLRRLLEDAIRQDAVRYGAIESLARDGSGGTVSARTTTGVTLDLDWATLSIRQTGRDTRSIDALYRIHYLQWTGIAPVDRVLGLLGLGSLVALAALGVRLAFVSTRQSV